MTDQTEPMIYEFTDGQNKHVIKIHTISEYELPAHVMNEDDPAKKHLNAVHLDPVDGMYLISMPSDMIPMFDKMNMICDDRFYSITNLCIKEIDLEGPRFWLSFNEAADHDLKYPIVKVGYIQQSVYAGDFDKKNIICQGPCIMTDIGFGPLSPYLLDSITRSIKFTKMTYANPTFCMDLYRLYKNVHDIQNRIVNE